MNYPKQVWSQLKNIPVEKLISALNRDGWERYKKRGASLIFARNEDSVAIHYHPKKTYSPGMLKALFDDIGWDESDLRRLKLIK